LNNCSPKLVRYVLPGLINSGASNSEVTLQEITRDNIKVVLALKKAPELNSLLPTVGEMIAYATLENHVWYRAFMQMTRRLGS
jgi:hypothetical protein